jgi:sugar phosphate isomerase/epimerase
VGSAVPLEVLLAETDPAVVRFEMDIYWLVKAGGDPIAYLARYPGRFTMVHAKDSSGPPEHRMMDVGSGAIDFRAILERATSAGLQHVFVEHDEPVDAMKSAAASYEHLARIER